MIIIKTLIPSIIYFITLFVMYKILNYYHTRDDKIGSDDNNYVVKMPKVMDNLGAILIYIGMFFFIFFGLFLFAKNSSITKGHFIFSLSLSSIGVLWMIWVKKWRITVHNDTLEIHRLFRKCITVKVQQVEKAELSDLKEEILIYYEPRKKIIINSLCDNYSRVLETFKKYGNPIEKSNAIEVKGITALSAIWYFISILSLLFIVLATKDFIIDKNILKYIPSYFPTVFFFYLGLHETRKYLYLDNSKIKYRRLFITNELPITEIDKLKFKRSSSNYYEMYNIKLYKNNRLLFSFSRVPSICFNKIYKMFTLNNIRISK